MEAAEPTSEPDGAHVPDVADTKVNVPAADGPCARPGIPKHSLPFNAVENAGLSVPEMVTVVPLADQLASTYFRTLALTLYGTALATMH